MTDLERPDGEYCIGKSCLFIVGAIRNTCNEVQQVGQNAKCLVLNLRVHLPVTECLRKTDYDRL